MFGVAALLLATGLLASAQQVQPNPRTAPNTQPPPQIISGADFGFRVDRVGPDGKPTGRIVVRQEGKWVEVVLSGGLRRLTAN